MTRELSKLLTATFAFILLGGVATPAMAQADGTTNTVTVNQTDKQTYQLSSIELPYVQVIENSQATKSYWLHKSSDDPTSTTQPHVLTLDQIADSSYMDAFYAANAQSPEAAFLTQLYANNQTLSLTAGETVGDYLTAHLDAAAPDKNNQELMAKQVFVNTWFVKYLTMAKLGKADASEISNAYQTELRPVLLTIENNQITMFDSLFGTPDSVTNWLDYLLNQLLAPMVTQAHLSGLSDSQRINLNPQASADQTSKVWNQPMTDYLSKQADGTYQLSGAIVYPLFSVVSDGTTIQTPTLPNPTPTPAQSQPVTVHYVDDQGKTLAKDQTLTGELGSDYRSEALNLTGYKLTKTPENATGKFTSNVQTVTYVYTTTGTLKTGSAGATVNPIAAKGTVVYATKKIGLYKSATFSHQARKQWYVKKSRMNRPMFVVTGYANSKNGVARYRVKDVNHHSRTNGQTGYITTKRAYTAPVYYATKHKTVTVINPNGVNSYAKANLTGKQRHYRQDQTLKIKKIVRHNLTTRFVLTNGGYITANKTLVQAGKVHQPRQIKTKHAINRYRNVNLTKRNKHYTKGTRLTVRGWAYSNANNFSRHDTLRYQVAGGYVTANPRLVKTIR